MQAAAAPQFAKVHVIEIVWIDSNEFCGFACAACSWKFAVPGARYIDGMPVELAKSGFDHHNCADYCTTATTLVTGLEEAIGKLAKVVHRCKSEK